MAIFCPQNYLYSLENEMHFTTWVFYNFSFLFGCSLQFYQFTLVLRTEILRFSSSLKCASPWNLEFFRFTQTSFFVHRKNSRFQGSAHFSFTGKTTDFSAQHQGSLIKLKVATKNAWKTTENSGCSMHLFSRPYKIFCGQKMATKEQFPAASSMEKLVNIGILGSCDSFLGS